MTKVQRSHKAGDGLSGAASALGRTVHSPDVEEILSDFDRLNSEEAQGWFADHFLSRSAGAIDRMWPVFYRMLKAMQDRHLYANPDYTTNRKSYGSFQEYFEDRVGRPFETWAKMERTYHYVRDYRPELFQASFGTAKDAAEAVAKAREQRSAAVATLDEVPIPREGRPTNRDNITVSGGRGTDESYLRRRLHRDHPGLYERVRLPKGNPDRLTAHAAAVEAGIVYEYKSVRVGDPMSTAQTLRKYMTSDHLAELVRLLAEQAD